MATAYDCKFIETSVGINHNVDELLVGLLSQIRLKLENPREVQVGGAPLNFHFAGILNVTSIISSGICSGSVRFESRSAAPAHPLVPAASTPTPRWVRWGRRWPRRQAVPKAGESRPPPGSWRNLPVMLFLSLQPPQVSWIANIHQPESQGSAGPRLDAGLQV